ncbi:MULTISPECIES: LPP20 family lipoprotein [Oceanimonas]|uniref:LPP20 family lipoprotein n=1 Tax=Oceanimonas smirnovii TaxID=264574 RepID=A0ABW7P585_9GAMM|nr:MULTISPECIES: LPP20 family lipoprotein [Oceanimonas]MDV2856397.1 LPP20 family lipoprotein [Oceanimonas sp. CAM02]
MRNKLITLLTLVFLGGCVGQGSGATPARNHIYAVGYAPISLQRPADYQQKLLHAMRASRLDAYRELSEQLSGVMISSSSEMNSNVLQDGPVNSASRGVVRGARVVNSYPDGDMYVTELELDLALYEKLRRGGR